MDFLIRFTQSHETFRLPEIQALAALEGIELIVKDYQTDSPFCLVTLPSPAAARRLVARAILVQSIYEHWATATTLPALRSAVRSSPQASRPEYATCSFKFTFDSFQATRPHADKIAIIDSFSFLPFSGPIAMRDPDAEFAILEEWALGSTLLGVTEPARVHFGRLVGAGARELSGVYNLKKRKYISTTSMDSELALVTANLALAAPGKLFYDPFVGTGSFPVACAHFGALAFGSDIDGRSIRGGAKGGVKANFEQYGLGHLLGGMFAADLTNTPLRVGGGRRLWDGIVCDPPYGVREGLKVLGSRDPKEGDEAVRREKSYLPDYIPPKKPYSFLAMLDDILAFAADSLVDGGRLAFWMPTSNEEAEEIRPPTHPRLEIVAVCSQDFNKWSRKLIAYRRIPDAEVDQDAERAWVAAQADKGKGGAGADGTTANELNPFRKMYFTKPASQS
ncbi:probable TRM11 Catalytic subunit of an adoMet-dependent tRNA methyltransferase complex (Trm11p-Trm112p) [Cephalotrichum gorgonifer]|uniref:tRNA (guanine(10)-N(2))-methyltransferase n=1 Tax=Cephalotrichum gorgonifer TaxID=2041049 RepID=A0AAE8SXN4_9PEZI|nr:probable TRM11 Catalytic subunit of an adoMet-dependent tRNA methyltransferase complex (Trm11p-Trm112p) [Cephalotrichum gorgonifer]